MTLLEQLRQLAPNRRLSMTEAYSIAERQAGLLLQLRGVEGPAVPTKAISGLPFVQVVPRLGLASSGATRWMKPHWVMLINAMEPPVRQRFTIAHEFKHLLDHPQVGRMYRNTTATGRRQVEQLCDYFAGCLLMPRAWVKKAYGDGIQDIVELAQLFEVSTQAMQVRLLQLGIVDPYARCGGMDNAYLRSSPASPLGQAA